LKPVDKAELAARSAITALATGPLNIMASVGSAEALAAGSLAGIVQLRGEAAARADGRRLVAAAFADMEPDQVEEWLQRDTRNLTLAVQAVIQATAAFDQQKIDALGRAFRTGVTESGRVDESILVALALGALERPHIDVLHVIVYEDPPLWSEQHDQSDESRDALPRPRTQGTRIFAPGAEAASLMLASGADIAVVSKLLGHASIAVTAEVYGHLVGTIAQKAVDGAANLIAHTVHTHQGVEA
jgi:hypothetical protein